MLRSSPILILAFALAGCSPLAPYVAPQSGETAKVRFIASGSGTELFQVLPGCGGVGKFSNIAIFAHLISQERTRVGMLDDSAFAGDRNVIEQIVPAGQEIRLQATGNRVQAGAWSCTVRAGFVPKADGQYEVSLAVGGGVLGPACRFDVHELSSAEGHVMRVREPSVHPLDTECKD